MKRSVLYDLIRKVYYQIDRARKTALEFEICAEIEHDIHAVVEQRLGQVPAGAKPLGKMTITGLACTGWGLSKNSHNAKVWLSDELGIVVDRELAGPKGTARTQLVSYSGAAPPPANFTLPALIKVLHAEKLMQSEAEEFGPEMESNQASPGGKNSE